MNWTPGRKLNKDRYTIQNLLEKNPFEINYIVKDNNNEDYVIQTLNDELLQGTDFEKWQKSFVQEVKKLESCGHRHIVKVKERFKEDNLECIVMEYVGNSKLSQIDDTIPELIALEYIRQIGEALNEAHKNGLIHGDVKPANIIRRKNKVEEVVLANFALAREAARQFELSTYTYMKGVSENFSPIELSVSKGERGTFTDVYSLAATLYWLLTIKVPDRAIERKLNKVNLIPPKHKNRQISDCTNSAIIKGMEIEPGNRYKSIEALLKSLGLKSQTTIRVGRNSTSRIIEMPDAMTFWTAVGASASLLTAIGAILGYVIGSQPSRPNPNQSAAPEVQQVPKTGVSGQRK